MKKIYSFRMSENTKNTINLLANELNLSKTEVIERGVESLLNDSKHSINPLLKYYGSVDPKYADKIFQDIKKSRVNKDWSLK
jgi:hypothetical protein